MFVFHISIASTIFRCCSGSSTMCISDQGGQIEPRPPLCMSTTISARGKRKRVMKSASCSSGGPSGDPGNERLRLAPDGHRRV